MTEITKEQQEKLITDYAYAANKYLRDVGCKREAHNVDPIWASTDDICEAIGASRTLWPSIRNRMLELDMTLALAYFGGYYIGYEGEQATIFAHKQAMIRGIANSWNNDIRTLARNGKTMSEVKDWADKQLGMELRDIPKILRALACPLPPQIEVALIESGE